RRSVSRVLSRCAIRDGLHLVVEALFAELRAEARMVCVGVGTGAELVRLAQRFPQWTFTAVDPSGALIEVCRRRAEDAGVAQRCLFHHGCLDSLRLDDGYDAATSFLVSQFIADTAGRSRFFAAIAARLRSGAVLASSDL